MKIQVSICAKDLPNHADVLSILKVDGAEVGKTSVEKGTDSPSWSKIVVVDAEPDKSISVAVVNDADGSEFGAVDFQIGEVMGLEGNAMANSLENGGAVAVHIEEHTDAGVLQLQLRGRRFIDMDGFRNKSDPFYEIKGLDRSTVYRSNVVQNNLNPLWPVGEVDLNAISGGDMDAPVQIRVYDSDNDGKKDFMGSISMSTRAFLSQKRNEGIPMILDGKKKAGEIYVEQAKLVPRDSVSPAVKEILEKVATVEAARWAAENRVKAARQTAEKKQQALELVKSKANAAEEEAATKASQVDLLKKAAADAEQEAADLQEMADKAAADAKEKSCTGTLKLQLRGSNFKDTDGFMNKSDPFYEVFGTKGEPIFRSVTKENDLNPVWPVADIEVGDACNGDFDMPIRVAFFDADDEKKGDYHGQIQMSVNSFTNAKASDPIPLSKGGQTTKGDVFVDGAEVVDFKDLKEEAKKAKEASLEAKRQVFEKSDAVKTAEKDSKEAREAANKAVAAIKGAEEEVEAAKQALAEAEAAL